MVSAPNGPEMDKMDILFWATFLKVFDSDHTKQSKQIDTFGLPGPPPPPALCSLENRLDLLKTSRLLEAAVVRLGEYGGQAYRNHKNIRSRWD
jgi:hypothetical protein